MDHELKAALLLRPQQVIFFPLFDYILWLKNHYSKKYVTFLSDLQRWSVNDHEQRRGKREEDECLFELSPSQKVSLFHFLSLTHS